MRLREKGQKENDQKQRRVEANWYTEHRAHHFHETDNFLLN